MENIKKESVFKKFIKNNTFVVVCFLSSLPLIALGIYGLAFVYRPSSTFQINNAYWIRPTATILFVVVVEFVIVFLPIIMVRSKNKKNKPNLAFNKTNLKKELSFNLISSKIALAKAKQNHNLSAVKQIHEQIRVYKTQYRTKLKELKNKTT